MVFRRGRKKLGEILVELEVLTARDVERVLEALRRRWQRQKFGRMARDMGLVREDEVLAALAVQMDLFPGIQGLSLAQVLRELQAPADRPAG
jgi:hypothetical protein